MAYTRCCFYFDTDCKTRMDTSVTLAPAWGTAGERDLIVYRVNIRFPDNKQAFIFIQELNTFKIYLSIGNI